MTSLTPSRLKFAEHSFNVHYVVPEMGTPFDALLNEAYWAHVSAKMKPNDRIVVDAEDGSYTGELIVRDAGKLYAKVAKITYVDLDHIDVKEEATDKSGYEVVYRGPHQKWSVVRLSDKGVMKDGMLKAEAHQWLKNHLQAVAA